jgi:hypothetical protein
LLVALGGGGCGDDKPSMMQPPGGSADAAPSEPDAAMGADAAMPDAEAPDAGNTNYPAFTPDMPRVMSHGGPVLPAMQIVTVTWSNDTNATHYEAFGDAIGATSYWRSINSEYGVGPATSGSSDHVHISTAPPMSVTNADLVNIVRTGAGGAPSSGWPAPAAGSLYVVYVSPQTTLMEGGSDICTQGVGGYHDETTVNGQKVAYAILPQCAQFGYLDVIQSSSHEMNEAATDPYPNSTPGYYGFDDDHLAWEFFMQYQDELGDACEFFRSSFYTETETGFSYAVQRQWSNASAVAGHDPCVPAPDRAFFNVTPFPEQMDMVTVDLTSAMAGRVHTKGYRATMGQARSFDVGFFSDRPTTGPWMLSAVVDPSIPDPNGGSDVTNGTATITIDHTSGQNGDRAHITVTPTSFSTYGVVYIRLLSQLNGVKHHMPLIISQN